MTILIADDHPIFSNGLYSILKKKFPKYTILEAENGKIALELALQHRPEICILDIDMPELSGIDVCKQIVLNKIDSKILFLTMHREKEMIRKAMLSGGSGYLLKENAADEIIDAIEKVKNNETFIGPSLQEFYQQLNQDDKRKKDLETMVGSLSRSEIKVMKLVASNKTTKEIADILFLSEKTIENYRSKICQKLQLPPRNNSLLLWISENREILSSLSEF